MCCRHPLSPIGQVYRRGARYPPPLCFTRLAHHEPSPISFACHPGRRRYRPARMGPHRDGGRRGADRALRHPGLLHCADGPAGAGGHRAGGGHEGRFCRGECRRWRVGPRDPHGGQGRRLRGCTHAQERDRDGGGAVGVRTDLAAGHGQHRVHPAAHRVQGHSYRGPGDRRHIAACSGQQARVLPAPQLPRRNPAPGQADRGNGPQAHCGGVPGQPVWQRGAQGHVHRAGRDQGRARRRVCAGRGWQERR